MNYLPDKTDEEGNPIEKIMHDPSLKKRILEELQGAKANKPRKQSRAEAQKIDEIYGK